MKTVVVFAFFSSFLALASRAQLSPPPSTTEGIMIRSAGQNQQSWQSSALTDYQLASSNLFQTPAANSADIYGRTWTASSPDKTTLNQKAGVLRLVFLGTNTNWDGAVGYTYSGSPLANTYTLAPLASTLSFGNYVDFLLGAGQPSTFDIWATGGTNTFCLFQPANNQPSSANGSVLWTRDPLLVSTYIPAYDSFQNVETWVASIDEEATDASGHALSYRVAAQFFYDEGGPLTAVPESSTYAITGTFALGLVVLWRRYTTR